MKKIYTHFLANCRRTAIAFLAVLFCLMMKSEAGWGQIAQRGVATSATSATATLTISKPSGVIAGDVLIANITQSDNDNGILSNASSSGWTLIDGRLLYDNVGNNSWWGTVLYRIADGTEGSNFAFALDVDANDGNVGSIIAFSGVDITTGYDAAGNANSGPFDAVLGDLNIQTISSSSITAASISTNTANAAIIMLAQLADNLSFGSWSTTSPGALTTELYDNNVNSAAAAAVGAAWRNKAPTGATGSGTATSSSSVRGRGAILIALRMKPAYQAQFISMSTGSSTWCAGETRKVSVTVKNVGTAAWADGGGKDFNIGVKWDGDPDYLVRTDVGGLAPGATGTFNFNVTAPASGSNHLTFDVVYEAVSWFAGNGNGVGPGNVVYPSAAITISTPTVSAGTQKPDICQGGPTITLGGSVGGSATGGTWDDGGVGGTFSGGSTNLNATWTPPAGYTGTATLTLITSGGSCGTATASKTEKVNALPDITISASTPDVCFSTSAQSTPLNYSATSGTSTTYSINWSPAGLGNVTNVAFPASSPISIAIPASAAANTYTGTLTVKNANGCVSTAKTFTVRVNALPTVASIKGATSVCIGNTTTLSDATPGGNWSSSNGSIATINPSTGLVTGIAAGTVNITYSVTVGNCTGTATIVITVNGLPAITSVIATPATICSGNQSNLVVTGSGSSATTTIVNYDFNSGSSYNTLTPTTAANITASAASSTASFGRTDGTASDRSAFTTNNTAGKGLLMSSPDGTSNNSWIFTLGGSDLNKYTAFKFYFQVQSNSFIIPFPELVNIDYSINGGPFVNSGLSPATFLTPGYTSLFGTAFFASGIFTLPSTVNNPNTLSIRITPSTGSFFGTYVTEILDNFQVQATIPSNTYSWTTLPSGATAGLPGTAGSSLASNNNINVTPAIATDYIVTATNANGCQQTGNVTVAIHNLWIGASSTNWQTVSNWSDGILPDLTCPIVTIPASTPYAPILSSGTATINNLDINTNAFLTVNNTGILQIEGSISNSGTFNASNGTLEFKGTSSQSLQGSILVNQTINNLKISNASGLTLTGASPVDTLNITGTLSFGVSNSIFTTNDKLTLKSTASGTASIGVIPVDGAGKALDQITGNVCVERYINIGSSSGQHGKTWQLLATPTKGQSIKQSWMEGGSFVSTGYGTQITGSGTGFDVYTATPALKYYDYLTENWIGITNTNNPVYRPNGYMLFVRGDRSITYPNIGNTTLRTKGTLITGNTAPLTVHANKFESVGNPYASAIDLTKLELSSIYPTIIVWDPTLTFGSPYGLGAFQTLYLNGSNNYENLLPSTAYGPSGTQNNFIQSGQAFFVQAGVSDGTISFTENAKTSGSQLILRPMGINNKVAQLRTNLYGINSNGSPFITDGTLSQYSQDFSNSIDGMDARKIVNPSENLSILSGGKNLVIERRTTLTQADTIFFNLTGVRIQAYKFEFIAKNLAANGLEGWVEDNYLHTRSPLNPEGTTQLNFAITNVAGSYAANRFRIVFKPAAGPLPVTFVSVNAVQKNADIEVTWKVENESNMQQYEVEKSIDGNIFTKAGTVVAKNGGANNYHWLDQKVTPGYNYYRIRSIDRNGQSNYTQIVKVLIQRGTPEITIHPNPITNGMINLQLINQPAGRYGIRLLNPLGQVIISKQISYLEGTNTETLKWDYNLAHGIYQLEVTKPNGEVTVIKVMY